MMRTLVEEAACDLMLTVHSRRMLTSSVCEFDLRPV